MIFSTWSFGLFFLVVCGLYWSLPTRRGQHLLLLAASYFFYMCWNPWMISLIIAITLFDYGVGVFLHRAPDGRWRRGLLIASLSANIGLLAVFKYADFFILSLRDLLDAVGVHANLHALQIILPVGISFHTFQTMSYTVDVYRRRVKPAGSLLEFALFVAFFPQLVAGPIVIAADFLPQLATRKRFEWPRIESGVVLFMVGLTKKLLIADSLALIADPVFADPHRYGTLDLWVAMLAYGGQILGDFAGYTDMAIATARILGFDLRPNFASPYLAVGMSDFWRRWHISLSSWLRDFLYIPLGGSHGGLLRTCRNLMATMLLGGLWHGASWTFVVWGGIHGAALVIARWFRQFRVPDFMLEAADDMHPVPGAPRAMPFSKCATNNSSGKAVNVRIPNSGLWLKAYGLRLSTFGFRLSAFLARLGPWAMTLLTVHIAWVFFRCQPLWPAGAPEPEPAPVALGRAWHFVSHLFVVSRPTDAIWLPNKLIAVMLLGLLGGVQVYEEWTRRGRPRLRLPAPIAGMAYAAWILVLVVFSPENTNPFIYFQF